MKFNCEDYIVGTCGHYCDNMYNEDKDNIRRTLKKQLGEGYVVNYGSIIERGKNAQNKYILFPVTSKNNGVNFQSGVIGNVSGDSKIILLKGSFDEKKKSTILIATKYNKGNTEACIILEDGDHKGIHYISAYKYYITNGDNGHNAVEYRYYDGETLDLIKAVYPINYTTIISYNDRNLRRNGFSPDIEIEQEKQLSPDIEIEEEYGYSTHIANLVSDTIQNGNYEKFIAYLDQLRKQASIQRSEHK